MAGNGIIRKRMKGEMFVMTWNDKLRLNRTGRGFTLQQAGQAIGASHGTLVAWEQGKVEPPLEKLGRLCEVYGISPLSLLDAPVGYEDLIRISGKPIAERSYQERIALAFGHDILVKEAPADTRKAISEASIRQAGEAQQKAIFLQRTNLLERYGGCPDGQTIAALMALYESQADFDEDILFSFHALTDKGRETFLRLLDVVLFDDHLAVADQAMDYTRGRLKAARQELAGK